MTLGCHVTPEEADELLTRCALLASLLRSLWATGHREQGHSGRWQGCPEPTCARIRERLEYAGMRGVIFEEDQC